MDSELYDQFLIHDSASGPVDFSGPRCIFPFRSSGFRELALALQRVSACPRVFIVSPRLGATLCQDKDDGQRQSSDITRARRWVEDRYV
jgi:hypothetical protein